ncbi:MAG: hypothetical protein ACYC27_21400 [Armatimonadota bacterium]
MDDSRSSKGYKDALGFPLIDALIGRRARRFALGAAIPDGPFAYESKQGPMPLTELEQLMILTATAGNTNWHFMHMHNPGYAPNLPNYSAAAGGRVFASAAGFHTSEIFYTDDNGVYFFPTRDLPAIISRSKSGDMDVDTLLTAHKPLIKKLADGRLNIPAEVPYMEGHNLWCSNRPGSMLIIPVGDTAQHMIATLCYYVQNGSCIYDDINNMPIEGLGQFRKLVDLDKPLPMSFVEQQSLMECTAELSMACYGGMLMLQAMGLGGWMYDGIDPAVVLGASGNTDIPGLGFHYVTDERWPMSNPTGLPGIFEAFCPPHYKDMRSAVDAFVDRKYGKSGPFNSETPGPWKESGKVRASAQVHSEEFKECVTVMAQHIYDKFGKFPGTIPSVIIITYLQAHHLDLEFYDKFFEPGAYLQTHAQHMELWHPDGV